LSPGSPRIFISAGEPSGDQHAARLADALRVRWPEARLEAFGGPALLEAGADVRYPMEQYTVLGFAEAVRKIPAHLGLLRTLQKQFTRQAYDLVVMVDYPGFNLRLGEAARRAGIPTLYYVAPQLWAWRPGRARRLRRAATRVAAILPFEERFFRGVGIETSFVGHPLAERCWPDRTEARRALGIPPDDRVLAILPGSRTQEVRRLWTPFRDTAQALLDAGACDRAIAAAVPSLTYDDPGPVRLVDRAAAAVLAAADAALVKSGTTTLEAACVGTPMVVAYRVHPLSAWLARRVMTVSRISLVNLVAEHDVVEEFVQAEVHPGRLVAPLRRLLEDPAAAAAQRRSLASVRERLGMPGAAARVAEMAGELLAA